MRWCLFELFIIIVAACEMPLRQLFIDYKNEVYRKPSGEHFQPVSALSPALLTDGEGR